MSFYKRDEIGNIIRNRVVLDCSGDKILVEQSHKNEVDINNIIKKHGIDMIQKTSQLMSQEFRFDDVSGNDFQEALHKVMKAKETFMSLPSKVRKEFDNNPAKFLDFVQNPENVDRMIELGLAAKPEPVQPVQVVVMNPETPPSPE